MRLLTSLGLILVLLIGSGFWINHSLQAASGRLSQKVVLVSANIEKRDWQAAKQETGKLGEAWEKDARWWPVFLDHQEMDNIEFSLARATEYVNSENKALAEGQLSELKLMLEHIPRKERVNLENIL